MSWIHFFKSLPKSIALSATLVAMVSVASAAESQFVNKAMERFRVAYNAPYDSVPRHGQERSGTGLLAAFLQKRVSGLSRLR
ncbi:hypothetical protein AJ87_35275 [Rhizobium yanglingense]|nr:hypothetical protein AJ87_35275 [Rhizobium yanglingense]